jgi:hypothetical protein
MRLREAHSCTTLRQQPCLLTCSSTRTDRLTKAQVQNGVSVCTRVKVSPASQLAFGRLLRRLACSTKSPSWKCFNCKPWKLSGKNVYHFLPHEWTLHFVRTASSNVRVLPNAFPSTDKHKLFSARYELNVQTADGLCRGSCVALTAADRVRSQTISLSSAVARSATEPTQPST